MSKKIKIFVLCVLLFVGAFWSVYATEVSREIYRGKCVTDEGVDSGSYTISMYYTKVRGASLANTGIRFECSSFTESVSFEGVSTLTLELYLAIRDFYNYALGLDRLRSKQSGYANYQYKDGEYTCEGAYSLRFGKNTRAGKIILNPRLGVRGTDILSITFQSDSQSFSEQLSLSFEECEELLKAIEKLSTSTVRLATLLEEDYMKELYRERQERIDNISNQKGQSSASGKTE